MAKRLTGTNKWDKAWFRKLSPRHKALWQFLCDRCDQAGMWEIDIESASHYINDATPITEADLKVFKDRVERYSEDKLWIVDFVDFQCGELSPKCAAHKPVFKLLKKYSLLDRVLHRLSNRQQEIEIEKEIEKEEEKEKETPLDFVSRESIDEKISSALDELYIDQQRMKWSHVDFNLELFSFIEKVRGSPDKYQEHDASGIRQAFQYQLRNAKKKIPNGKNDRTQQNLNDIAIALNHAAGGSQGSQ